MAISRTDRQKETKPQAEKFKAMAKEVEADGDEKALDRFVKKIARKNAKRIKT
jgi:hypothetical protein